MLRHVGLCMPENGLRVLQAEFVTDVIRVRVSHLVRNPSLDACFLASPCNCTTEGRPRDAKQLCVRIGRKILRQNQLRLWPEMQSTALFVMNGLVIADFRRPDVSKPIE